MLCSCSKKEETPKVITADMLNITDNDETFIGCRNRFEAVISAMKAKVSILEAEHNNTLKMQNETEYFLEKDYIHTTFEPFLLEAFTITDGFRTDMTNETAQTFYDLESGDADIVFESDGKSSFTLQFVSETQTKKYTVLYDQKADSFRYVYSTEDADGEHAVEFLEFSKTESDAYVIQSKTDRCYIKFNDENKIEYFCCGKLNKGEFSGETTIYPAPGEAVDSFWVLSKGKSAFSSIHTFEDGILTHEDCSSGPWKTIKINAADYASAFYF